MAVDSGTKTTSSWSLPNGVCPFSPRTPITVKGTRRMRIVRPIGSAPANSSRTTVPPTSATLAAERNSLGVMARPLATTQLRASKYSRVTP